MVFLFWQHCALHSFRAGAGGQGAGEGGLNLKNPLLSAPVPERIEKEYIDRAFTLRGQSQTHVCEVPRLRYWPSGGLSLPAPPSPNTTGPSFLRDRLLIGLGGARQRGPSAIFSREIHVY